MEQRTTASNLTELMFDHHAEMFLTVNGFSLEGSGYDRFLRICNCVERAPEHPFSRYLQSILENGFSILQPMIPQNCNHIWKITAERMLIEDRDWSAFATDRGFEILPPRCSQEENNSCFCINGIQLSHKSWQEWRTEAEMQLLKAVERGDTLAVTFPSDYAFEKPNLYRVERHLFGIEKNQCLWSAQLLYFLCDFCHQSELRCRVNWGGDCEKLADLLQYVSKLTPIPNLLLQCDAVDAESLHTICKLVISSQTKRNEGVPPVLLID